MLLQSEEELLAKRSSELVSEGAAPKIKKIVGKMKVQGNTSPGINIFVIKILCSAVLLSHLLCSP